MDRSRSALLASWGCAWLAGTTSPDELLRAVVADDRPHVVTGLPEVGSLLDVLLLWRRSGDLPRVVFPVAGDVRGLPGPASFRAAALAAGEAVVAGGVGLVPDVVDHRPSSAGASVTWTVSAVEPGPADWLQLEQAGHELTDAVRETASDLARLDVAGGPDVRPALSEARRAGERLDLPAGFPSRAVALIAQAERLAAVLELAGNDPVGGARDAQAIGARSHRLRQAGELATAVRRARQAGYNARWHEPAPVERPVRRPADRPF